MQNASVNGTVYFGSYEGEQIQWTVLAKENGKALLISTYALECKPYHTSNSSVTWETCSLREWLNSTFFDAAFSAEEQEHIIKTTVSADKNSKHSTSPGNATQDRVFLMSITEATKYFNSDKSRICKPTGHAKAQGVSTNISGACCWWLRSPGYRTNRAACVDYDYGDVNYSGYDVISFNSSVRPALWISY